MATMVARLNVNDETLRRVELSSTDDCNYYDEISRALRNNHVVEFLHINDRVFSHEGFRSPTWKRLRMLVQSVCYMKSLEELGLIGKMSLDNIHDVKILANAIKEHPVLKKVKLEDFIIYAADHPESVPLLEPLLTSASSIENLETFQLKCLASYKRWSRSFMTSQVLIPVCRSVRMQSLSLSNVGLQDEHFLTIAREIGDMKETSTLKELILNDNQNTDAGVEAMAQLLGRNNSITRLDIRNSKILSESTCELLLHRLDKNQTITHMEVNAPYQYRTEIEFYLLLNRAGRKALLDPGVVPEEAVDLLAAANDNVSILMHLLRDNPALCKAPITEEEEGTEEDDINGDSTDNHESPEIYSPKTEPVGDQAVERNPLYTNKKIPKKAKSFQTTQNDIPVLRGFSEESVLIWRQFWYRAPSGSSINTT